MDRDGWPQLRRKVRRTSLVSAVVFLVLWAPPLIEEALHGSDGDLQQSGEHDRRGEADGRLVLGPRIVAAIVSLPPWWLRPSFGDAFVPKINGVPLVGVQPDLAHVPSLAAAVISMVVVLALVGTLLRDAWRRADRTASAALATALVAAGGALVTAGTLPRGFFGIAPHQFRWLWPVSLFMLFAVALAIVRRSSPLHATKLTGAFGATAVLLAVLNLPVYNQHTGPSAERHRSLRCTTCSPNSPRSTASTRSCSIPTDCDSANHGTPRWSTGSTEHGHEIVVDDPVMIRQYGTARAFDGHTDGELVIEEGDNAMRDYPRHVPRHPARRPRRGGAG